MDADRIDERILRRRIAALEKLCACYRIGRSPSEELLDELAATRAALAGQAAAPDDVERLPSLGRPVGRRRLEIREAPDGPRTWQLPDEPGPEVTAVRDRDGHRWVRFAFGWRLDVPKRPGHGREWQALLYDRAPLADATPVDGHNGDAS